MQPEGRSARAPAVRAAGLAVAALGGVGAAELLAFAPASQLGDLRVVAVAVALHAPVAAALALACAAAVAAARAGGLRVPPGAVALVATLGLVAAAHLGPLVEPRARALLPGLPAAAVSAGVGLATAAGGAVFAAAATRAGARLQRLVPLGVAALLTPIGVAAGVRGAIARTALYDVLPALAAGAAVFLAVAALLGALPRRRGPALAAWTLAGVALLRLSIPNPHDPVARGAVPEPRDGEAPGPPVVLIVLDTLRADALELDDPDASATPELARLARHSDVYTRAVANGSWTLPGHASLLTGRVLTGHRTDLTPEPGFAPALDARLPTLTERLARAGYRTACIAANGILGDSTGLARGCHRYQNPGRAWLGALLPMRLVDLVSHATEAEAQLLVELSGVNLNATADEIVDAAVAALEPSSPPLFLLLNFLDVHGPLAPAPEGVPPPAAARRAHRRDLLRRALGRLDDDAYWRAHAELLRAYYDAQLRVLDRELGRLFDALRARGLYDSTLLVVSSDHGEAFVENPALPSYFGHHGAYEPAVRIPLLLKRPGQRDGRRFDHLVQQADLLPSVLELAGLPPAEGVEGRPLWQPERDAVVTEWYARGAAYAAFPFLQHNRLAVYSGDFKYVTDGLGRERLYDLSRSPFEGEDVLDERPELAAALRARLLEHVGVESGAPDDGAPVDPHLRLQLEALGYAR